MIVLLHNIRSLYNVGSVFRTADAAGIQKIYLCGITPVPVDRFGKPRIQFTKVSLGAEKYVAWEKISKTEKILDKLKKEGYKILAIEQSKKSISYYKLKVKSSELKKTVLILGNEANGLSKLILRKSDKILEIPMKGRKESLNVSIAFGIVVFDLLYK
jgi:tRNA G18 (ribose-2'-O)-methylase SpoU